MISIGNISMGGRGKSPLAGLVAEMLVQAGERPSILSRGYGREIPSDGVTVVSDGQRLPDGRLDVSRLADLAESGDEPLMLARAVPGAAVLVCEQRALAGALAERALGCTVHVLDDGFQHHRLHRDIDIVLVSAEDLAGRPLPFGKLREPVETLKFADALIFEGSEVSEFQSSTVSEFQRFALSRSLGTPQLWNSETLKHRNPETLQLGESDPVFAVAGIANPDRFFDSLKTAGYTVVGTLGFADHHRYSAADVRRIRDDASRSGATAIATTSKDIVRLEKASAWPVPLIEIPLEVSVEPAAAFHAWLFRRLAEARQ